MKFFTDLEESNLKLIDAWQENETAYELRRKEMEDF